MRCRGAIVGACCMLVSGLFLTGCAPGAESGGAADPAVTVATVCDVLSVGDVERVVGQKVSSVEFRRYEYRQEGAFDCVIRFQGGLFEDIKIYYQMGYFKGFRSRNYRTPTPETVFAYDEAQPLVAQGVEGEGVLINGESERAAIAWEYPDGHLLSMLAVRQGSPGDQVERRADLEVLRELFDLIAADVPAVAASAAPSSAGGTGTSPTAPVPSQPTSAPATPATARETS